jgi:hypothetical protein
MASAARTNVLVRQVEESVASIEGVRSELVLCEGPENDAWFSVKMPEAR